jgi:hypothetical protein
MTVAPELPRKQIHENAGEENMEQHLVLYGNGAEPIVHGKKGENQIQGIQDRGLYIREKRHSAEYIRSPERQHAVLEGNRREKPIGKILLNEIIP